MTLSEKSTLSNPNTSKINLTTEEPFFSIITPVFNSAKFLPEYFTSLITQQFSNFEVIMVDDSSFDHSLSIIKEYQKKLPQLKLLQQSNCGQGVARNKALQMVKGKYILFIDSDDFLASPYSLKELYNHLNQTPSEVTIFAYQKVYGHKIFNHKNKQSQLLKSNPVTTAAQKIALLQHKQIGGPWNKVYDRLFLQQNSIQFAEKLKFEDAYFFWQIIICAKQINFFNCLIYSYRKHNLATMRTNNNKNLDIIKIYELIINFLEQKELLKQFYNTLISRALLSFVSQFKKTPWRYKKEFFTKAKEFVINYIIENNIKEINKAPNHKECRAIKALSTNNFWCFYLKSFLL